jgi:hypothetical protein
MFQYSRRDNPSQSFSASQNIQTSAAPDWAKASFNDTKSIVAEINLASACPYCANYNLAAHACDLYGEPIPERERAANPCKGNTFNRKQCSGNRLAQLRALRGA